METDESELFDWRRGDELQNLSGPLRKQVMTRWILRVSTHFFSSLHPGENKTNQRIDNAVMYFRAVLTLYCQLAKPDLNWPTVPKATFRMDYAHADPASDFEGEYCSYINSLLNNSNGLGLSKEGVMGRGPMDTTNYDLRGHAQESNSIELRSQLHGSLMFEPLFPNKIPQNSRANIERGKDNSNTAIVYFAKWFEDLSNGKARQFSLYEQILGIEEQTWEAGAEAVAERIKEIESDYNSAFNAEQAQIQAKSLLKNASRSELEASGLSELINMAVQAYEREISNCLPEELEPLAHLPNILDQIAITLSGDQPETEKEQLLAGLVQNMSSTINELNRRLERLHADVKSGSGRRLFADAFYTNAGAGFGKMVSSKLLWGGAIAGCMALVGVGSEAATDKLAWLCHEVILSEGAEAVQLPSSSESNGPKFLIPKNE